MHPKSCMGTDDAASVQSLPNSLAEPSYGSAHTLSHIPKHPTPMSESDIALPIASKLVVEEPVTLRFEQQQRSVDDDDAPSSASLPTTASDNTGRTTAAEEDSSAAEHRHTRSNNHHLRMEDVGLMMREQDADLLESIHANGPNQTGMTPVLVPLRQPSEDGAIPPFQLDGGGDSGGGGGCGSMIPPPESPTTTSPKQRNMLRNYQKSSHTTTTPQASPRPSQRYALARSEANERSSLEEAVTEPAMPEPNAGGANNRRALSGLVFALDLEADLDAASAISIDLEDHNHHNHPNHHKTRDNPDLDSSIDCIKHSESKERRINEAAQFAEAVGDIPPTQQEDLLIIDDGDDASSNEEEDDDATEVHVDRAALRMPPPKRTATAIPSHISTMMQQPGSPPPEQYQQQQQQQQTTASFGLESSDAPLLPSASSTMIESPIKARPTFWPRDVTTAAHHRRLSASQQRMNHPSTVTTPSTARSIVSTTPDTSRRAGFLAQLPSSMAVSAQDFVYKGIRSNPPDIVKQGTTRGNYAQLHRKAWLEVSDKYHRYGKHLRLYYRYWERLGCPTNMFFDWLDSKGEAAGQPLPVLEDCPRSQLDADTVLYITNPDVTAEYALHVLADSSPTGHAAAAGATAATTTTSTATTTTATQESIRRGCVVDVDGTPVQTGPDGWIFVLRDNVMYGAPKITSVSGHSRQRFHHSSFFGGKAVAAAGIFITDDHGYLTKLYPHSGHYRPGEAHMQRVLFFLYHMGINLRTFEMDMQQIVHIARDGKDTTTTKTKDGKKDCTKSEKKKKIESLHLMPAILVACFLAHKARFIGEGVFAQIHQIRKADVATVTEALLLMDQGGHWCRQQHHENVIHR